MKTTTVSITLEVIGVMRVMPRGTVPGTACCTGIMDLVEAQEDITSCKAPVVSLWSAVITERVHSIC